MSRYRRAILSRIEKIVPSAWDYDWTSEKGHLDANNYVLSGVNSYGGGVSYPSTGGVLFTVDNYQNVEAKLNELVTSESGILEATFNIGLLSSRGVTFSISSADDSCNVQIINQNGDYMLGVQTSQYEFLYNTGLESTILNNDCTLRIEFAEDGAKKVYLNGTLMYEGPTYKQAQTNRIWVRYDSTVLVKAIKWKL